MNSLRVDFLRNLLVTERDEQTRGRSASETRTSRRKRYERVGRTELEVSLGERSNGGDVDLVVSWKDKAEEGRP